MGRTGSGSDVTFSLGLDDHVPPLEGYCSPAFFRVLASPYREAYWAVLVAAHARKFSAAVALTRPDAIDLAERVLDEAAIFGIDVEGLAWESGWDLPELEDDVPRSTQHRGAARRLLRVLEHAGWLYFQTYATERYPVLELTLVGQRQIAHMLRDMRGQRLPLVSFADRLGELVGNRCSAMRATPGRLRQLRDIVAQFNERLYELLGSIKAQSEGVFQRARTIHSILENLLVEFERHVGADYALLKRKESPPRLWTAVTQAVYDLQGDSIWLQKEAAWYREEGGLEAHEDALRAVLEDLQWVTTVMDGLGAANELLDQRYARYVSLARRRVEAQLRHGSSPADAVNALLEASVRGFPLAPVSVVKVVTVSPVGFQHERQTAAVLDPEPVPEVADLTEAEARAFRRSMDDSIPLAAVRQWLGGGEGGAVEVAVDALPLDTESDYLHHLYAVFYATLRHSGVTFAPTTCGAPVGECPTPDTCAICYRTTQTATHRLRLPRGTYSLTPLTLETP